jgi:hypothetical protein
MRPPVLTKEDMWVRYGKGEFGNRLRSWLSLEALQADGYGGLVVVRYKAASAQWIKYGIPQADVPATIDRFVAEGADRSLFVFNEAAPDDKITIQGEYLRNAISSGGHQPGQLHYSLEPGTHRGCLRDYPKWADGLEAKWILQRYLDQPSYDWLMELTELYPDHTVEFSTFRTKVGDLRWNTIFWEIRAY